MKKFNILLAGILALGVMTGCKQNTEPKYEPAHKFELNTPALADQYYQLTPDGTIDLTWSQPEWGFAAAPDYKVQISFYPDFKYYANDTYSYVYELPTVYHACQASVPMEEMAIGICTLRGITDEDQYTDEPARTVYVRIVGAIPQIAESYLVSNSICLKQVKEYCAIQSPGKMYLVGAPEGWKGPDAGNLDHYLNWALFEPDDAIGSQVYSNTFEIPAGNAMFRFYTALTGWDADSWGSQADDNPIDYTFTDGEFNHEIVKGKGSFNFPTWEGGSMAFTIDMNTHKLIIKAN